MTGTSRCSVREMGLNVPTTFFIICSNFTIEKLHGALYWTPSASLKIV